MRTLLVSAYACEPFKGSEQGVGWNWVLQMAKSNKVLVITRANNKAVIEQNIPQNIKHNLQFFYYDTHSLIKSLKKGDKGLYFYYFFWQLGITSLVRKILQTYNVDYTMHLTMGSIWMPTFLPFFNTPFIWGPVGGGEGEPNSFLKLLPLKQRFLQYARLILNKTIWLNPFIGFKIKRASKVICRTQNTASLFSRQYKEKIDLVLETAMENPSFKLHKKTYEINDKIKLITTGRLIPSKNINLLIKSLSLLDVNKGVELIVIGSGPSKKSIEHERSCLGANLNVEIIDNIPRMEVLKMLQKADVFVFPSLREGGSWSLMEAMAIGLPVICLNWTGMAIITDEHSAIQLPVTDPEKMTKDLALALQDLIKNPVKREKLGKAARQRIAEKFNWDSKGDFMENLLQELDSQKEC
jgi:glycosyltransferase involved in cell wall biosynthesis